MPSRKGGGGLYRPHVQGLNNSSRAVADKLNAVRFGWFCAEEGQSRSEPDELWPSPCSISFGQQCAQLVQVACHRRAGWVMRIASFPPGSDSAKAATSVTLQLPLCEAAKYLSVIYRCADCAQAPLASCSTPSYRPLPFFSCRNGETARFLLDVSTGAKTRTTAYIQHPNLAPCVQPYKWCGYITV